MHTFSFTSRAMFLLNQVKGFIYLFEWIKKSFVHEAIQPLSVIIKLYFAEHCLNWVQLWTVGSIKDWHDVQIFVHLFYVKRSVHLQVVHEYGKVFMLVDLDKFL